MDKVEQLYAELQSSAASELISQVAQFLVWVIVIFIITWLIGKGISRTITDNVIRYRARKAARLMGYILIMLLALVTFTGKVQYFTLTVGLISAGMAFALQEVILSIAGWVAIYSTGIYKPGDRIEINQVKGDVIDIGLTKTTLMEIGEWVKSDNYSGRIVMVSNSQVFKGAVFNYSSDFPFLWDEIKIPVRYESDIKLAETILLSVAGQILSDYANHAKGDWKQMVRNYRIENAVIEPTLSIALTDNWIEFNLRYIVDYKLRRTTKDKLYRDIYKQIENTGGKVKIASATFELTGVPDISIYHKTQD